jgi:VWFA-related protein
MRHLAISLLAATLAVPCLAQSTPQQPQPSAAATLHTASKLVIVDVVVTDQQHHPVHNLKRDDFILREDSTQQSIRAFEEHIPPPSSAKPAPMPTLPPGVFTNITTAPTNGPINILLLDTLNTAMSDQSRVRLQLLDFLNKAKPGTRIAIFGLTTRLTLMQGFTDDPALLKASVSKSNLKSSPLLVDPVGGGAAPLQMSDEMNETAQSSSMGATIQKNATQQSEFEAKGETVQTTSRAKYTLDAMNALARYLVGIPGRKNLIWFSGSFPINILPDPSLSDAPFSNPLAPFTVAASDENEFRETTNMLARSQVAVYPISAKGVAVLPTTNAAESNSLRIGRSDKQATADANSATHISDENFTMRQMALQTGGRAFVDTNDLTDAINASIEDGSNYYTIAYTPSNDNWNGTYRKIEVQLQSKGVDLSYRRGYYSDDPGISPRRASAVAPASHSTTLGVAMQRGSPTPTQISFAAHVQPSFVVTEKNLAPGNQGSKTIKGPYRRYSIGIAADPAAIAFTISPDGTRHGSIEIVTFVYDAGGALINTVGNTLQTDFTPARYAKISHDGLPFEQQVSVPAKGTCFLRIGVHDLRSDRIGAVEIPISAVSNLPPAQQLPTVSPE